MSLVKLGLASFLALLFAFPQDTAPKPAAQADLAKLSWLAGTWELKDGENTTEESWLPLAGSTMLGVSHTYDAKTTHFFEFLRITLDQGKIVYYAHPGGERGARFPAVKVTEKDVVFENPLHDHPQVIRYERTESGVTATISLLDGSKATTYAYHRRAK